MPATEPLAEASYYDAAQLVLEAFEALLPIERLNVADYAAKHRWLANEGGGYVGLWQHAWAPYLREPMECLTSLDHLTVGVWGPGQSGKSSIGENALLRNVAIAPADALIYMQTDAALESFVKARLNPMIDQHPQMRDKLGPHAIDDSLHFKRFRGMRLELLTATLSNLISKSAPWIWGDEIDAYVKGLGDVKSLWDIRRQTFGRESKLLVTSHADLAEGLDPEQWNDGIAAIYRDSDRRLWWWPCPHCGAHSSPLPIAPRFMSIRYPVDAPLEEIFEAARLLCPVSGCLIEDKHRRAMNQAGFWAGLGQEVDEEGDVTGERIKHETAGFWIHGAMSLFTMGGIGGLARDRAKAERKFQQTGEIEDLQHVVAKRWGEPRVVPKAIGSVDAETLAERAAGEYGIELGQVAERVRFLTAGVDVQAAHFEIMVRGWGLKGESWIVDKYRRPADPALSPADWDALLGGLVQARYPLADGNNRVMAIRGIAFDSGGAPGVTAQAYDAWKRFAKLGAARRLGKLDGRDIWSIIPTKGAAGPHSAKLQTVYPDSARKDRKVGKTGAVPLGVFNANAFKDDLAGQLALALPDAWYVHFPPALRSKEKPHVFFEQVVAETRDAAGRWSRRHQGIRNEALDLMVMCHVVAHLHGLARIDWARPPAWAAEWDKNSMVSAGAPSKPAESVGVPVYPPSAAAPAGPPPKKRSLFSRLG
jgi:phage terminase large subunit GpA-like protein